MLTLVNAVGSGDLCRELDLHALSEDIPDSEYNSPGLHVRFSDESSLVTLFRSGKYTIVGSSSHEQLYETQQKLLNLMLDLGVIDSAEDPHFGVRNLVSTAELGHDLRLEEIPIVLGLEQVEYEPEVSPFLVYRPQEVSCVMTIPATGKIMVTGVTDMETAEKGVRLLKEKLAPYVEQRESE